MRPILEKQMTKNSVRRAINLISWIVTLVAILTTLKLVQSAYRIADELEDQVVYDTLVIHDTVTVVEQPVDVCPKCFTELPGKIGLKASECPSCGRMLIRMKEHGKIFTLE